MSIYAEGLSGASTRCIVGTRHLSIVSSVDSDLKRRLAKGGVVAILINVVRVGVPINNLSFRPGEGGGGRHHLGLKVGHLVFINASAAPTAKV